MTYRPILMYAHSNSSNSELDEAADSHSKVFAPLSRIRRAFDGDENLGPHGKSFGRTQWSRKQLREHPYQKT